MDKVIPHVVQANVSLEAIARNLSLIKNQVGNRKVLAAVKANAYGHGAVKISKMIERTTSADWLGVATVPEAIELRRAEVTLPILKLSHCFEDELEAGIAADIAFTVVNKATISQLQWAAAKAGKKVAVHINLDSGMRRIGAELSEGLMLAKLVDQLPNLYLQGIFTHLPISDNPKGDEFTRLQLANFTATVETIQAERGPVELIHTANSGAILCHDLGITNMVRPGIIVYGYYPDLQTPRILELEPAMRLISKVSFIKRIQAGETVGYGRTFTAQEPTWIATIPIGYADGYSRLLSNRGRVLISGKSYPIAGRVCMDQLMVNLGSEIPKVFVGEEVVLLGKSMGQEITIWEIASLMETIPHEVTCVLTSRVERTYFS